LRRRYLPLAAAVGAAIAVVPAVTGLASSATVQGTSQITWSPEKVTLGAPGSVMFENPSGIPHGIVWSGGPETPSCESGVPVDSSSSSNWKGSCTFTKEGTYTYYCSYHGMKMSGTITVGTPTPTATTEHATGVTETGATLNGTVNPQGQATSYYFEYGPTTAYGSKTTETSAGSGSAGVAASAAVTGLTPHTPYHFRLVAVYGAANTTVPGPDLTFETTASPGTPTATTEQATGVTQTEATLNGSVNPEGQATSYYFKYGTTTAYGSETTKTEAGSGRTAQPVHATLTGLSPGTPYYYQLVAVYGAGTTAPGEGMSFTTLAQTTTTTSTSSTTSTTSTSTGQPPAPTSTTSTTTTRTSSTPVGEEGESPGGAFQLASTQKGGVVRGSVEISRSGVGGRLQIELLAASASLAKAKKNKHGAPVRVGTLVRTGLRAGKVSFSVMLSPRAEGAVRRHHRLAVTVKLTITPTHGKALVMSRSAVVRR